MIRVPASSDTKAYALNDIGQIVGTYTDATGTHGFIGTAGGFQKLTLPDGTDVSPTGINNLGQIVANTQQGGFLLSPITTKTSNTIVLKISQDAYKGDAQFIVKVNGEEVGDVQTVHASHASGQWDTITLQSTVSDPTQVQIQFINDLYEWSPSADRNLYVQSLTFDGRTFDAKSAANTAGHNVTDAAALLGNGTLTFKHVQDTLKLRVAEDNYMGDAKFIVTVDGVQVGGVQTAHASHAEGQWEDITLTGDFGHANRVAVQFINDANGGPGLDRNLYIDSINLNGTTYKGSDASVPHGLGQTAYSAELWTNASAVFSTGPDSVVFRVAEDAYKGDAQFIVKVDGQQVGGVQTAHSSHAQGQWEDITLHGSFAGANYVSVEFINDANGGPGQDRNLYIDSISLDGHVVRGTAATVAKGIGQTVYSAELWTNGVADFNVSTLHHADLIA
jgi:endoglucanase